jgi:hypothetical protein
MVCNSSVEYGGCWQNLLSCTQELTRKQNTAVQNTFTRILLVGVLFPRCDGNKCDIQYYLKWSENCIPFWKETKTYTTISHITGEMIILNSRMSESVVRNTWLILLTYIDLFNTFTERNALTERIMEKSRVCMPYLLNRVTDFNQT